MIVNDLEAWLTLKIVNIFLGNHKRPAYKNVIVTLLDQ